MTDNQARQLMQDALDGKMTPEAEARLAQLLKADPDHAAEYDQQQRVDNLLRFPPMERAPRRLAEAIMSKLAAVMKAQPAAESITEAQLRAAIELVTVTTLPLLVGAGYLLLNAQAETDERIDENTLTPVALMLILVIDVMVVLLDEAESIYEEDPELAAALLALLPTAMLEVIGELLDSE